MDVMNQANKRSHGRESDFLRKEKVMNYRPFRLTRAIARVRVSTRANLSARAICRTHEKSYSAEKVLFIEYSSFNLSFMFTSAIFEYCGVCQ